MVLFDKNANYETIVDCANSLGIYEKDIIGNINNKFNWIDAIEYFLRFSKPRHRSRSPDRYSTKQRGRARQSPSPVNVQRRSRSRSRDRSFKNKQSHIISTKRLDTECLPTPRNDFHNQMKDFAKPDMPDGKTESISCKIALAFYNNFKERKNPKISSRLEMADFFYQNRCWCPNEFRGKRNFSQVLFAMIHYWKFCSIFENKIIWRENNHKICMFHVLGKCKFGHKCHRQHHDILTNTDIAKQEADKLLKSIPFVINNTSNISTKNDVPCISTKKDVNHITPTASPVFQPKRYNGFESRAEDFDKQKAPWN